MPSFCRRVPNSNAAQLGFIYSGIGISNYVRGRFDRGASAYLKAMELARKVGDDARISIIAGNLRNGRYELRTSSNASSSNSRSRIHTHQCGALCRQLRPQQASNASRFVNESYKLWIELATRMFGQFVQRPLGVRRPAFLRSGAKSSWILPTS